MTITFCSTRSHEQFILGQKQLTTLAGQQILTYEQLHKATEAMYDDGDYIDRSIGFQWIMDHPTQFAETAARCGFKVSDFLREHGHIYWVGNRILLNPALVALVDEHEREEFVKEIYRKHGSFAANSWVEVVLQAGIPMSTVAELIIEKLESVPDDCETRNYVHALNEFLNYHGSKYSGDMRWSVMPDAEFSNKMELFVKWHPDYFLYQRACIEGRIGTKRYEELAALAQPIGSEDYSRARSFWEVTQWTVLTDAQFDTAMQIAARKTPRTLFGERKSIEARLGEVRFAQLGTAAIAKLAVLSPEQQKFVEEQSIGSQFAVASNLNGNADFILRVILKLSYTQCINLKIDPAAGRRLFRAKSHLFADRISEIYRKTWTERHKNGKPIVDWLEAELERMLDAKGYIIGTVEESNHTPKGGTARRQMQVRRERNIYVQERRQYNYTPKPGDQVLIATFSGYQLTPKVTATEFYPVDRLLVDR